MRMAVQRSVRTKAKAGIDCDAGGNRDAFHDGMHVSTASFANLASGFKKASAMPPYSDPNPAGLRIVLTIRSLAPFYRKMRHPFLGKGA